MLISVYYFDFVRPALKSALQVSLPLVALAGANLKAYGPMASPSSTFKYIEMCYFLVITMSSENVEDVLKGLTLRVYRYVLKNKKETGVREVQRALKLSSPTLAVYHLEKLEEAGLIKRGASGYIVDRVYLRNLIRFRRLLVPKYFFYALFFTLAVVAELTVFRPVVFSREYVFAFIITCAAAVSYLYETVMTWMKETI